MEKSSYGIIGIGSAVPMKILDNRELSILVDTSDEWIMSHVGIKERHICSADEASSDLMLEPARIALTTAGITINDVDVIFVTTSFPDQLVPLSSDDFARKIGAKNTLLAIDVPAACAGFVWALGNVMEFLDRNDEYNTVLLVSGDATSKQVDYKDRNTCVLFGDGGGAVVIQRQDQSGLIDIGRYSDRAGYKCLSIKAGGSAHPASRDTIIRAEHMMHFGEKGGGPMLREIVGKTPDLLEKFLEKHAYELGDVDHLIPHQLNEVIVSSLEEKLIKRGLRKGVLFKENIANFGNCSGSSVPMALDTVYRQGRLKPGDVIVLAAWATGMKFGFAILEWTMPVFV